MTTATTAVTLAPQPTKPSIVDHLVPFGVGGRSEILGLLAILLKLVQAFHGVDAGTADSITGVLYPTMAVTVAAKLQRIVARVKRTA
jgi:hypothetical protein